MTFGSPDFPGGGRGGQTVEQTLRRSLLLMVSLADRHFGTNIEFQSVSVSGGP